MSTQASTPRSSAEPTLDVAFSRGGARDARRSKRRSRQAVACAIGAAVLGFGVEAAAQDQVWLKDRRYTEGAGIRVGDFELHPGIAAEFGYDSNYLRRADDAAGGTGGSLRLRITPSLSLATLGPQRTEGVANTPPPDVEFRSTLSATYNEFFGVGGSSDVQRQVSQSRNLTYNLDLNLNILPRREWSGSIYAGAGRAAQPNESGGFDQFAGAFDRDLIRAGAELIFTPGAGLLDWRLGYRFSGTLFEQTTGLTNLEQTIQTRGRWRFLPRTAMLFDLRQSFINYVNQSGNGNNGSKTGSHPLRVQLGVSGLITPSFGVLAMVGWGASFYDPSQQAHDFDSLIGQAEVKWYLTPNPSAEPSNATLSVSSLSLGFIRDFNDSYLGTYVERDRGYANFSYFFGGRFLLVIEGGAGPAIYPAVESVNGVAQANPQPWTDVRYDASIFGEYRLKDYFGINATLRYSGNASSHSVTTSGQTGIIEDSLQWQAFEAYLGARLLY